MVKVKDVAKKDAEKAAAEDALAKLKKTRFTNLINCVLSLLLTRF